MGTLPAAVRFSGDNLKELTTTGYGSYFSYGFNGTAQTLPDLPHFADIRKALSSSTIEPIDFNKIFVDDQKFAIGALKFETMAYRPSVVFQFTTTYLTALRKWLELDTAKFPTNSFVLRSPRLLSLVLCQFIESLPSLAGISVFFTGAFGYFTNHSEQPSSASEQCFILCPTRASGLRFVWSVGIHGTHVAIRARTLQDIAHMPLSYTQKQDRRAHADKVFSMFCLRLLDKMSISENRVSNELQAVKENPFFAAPSKEKEFQVFKENLFAVPQKDKSRPAVPVNIPDLPAVEMELVPTTAE